MKLQRSISKQDNNKRPQLMSVAQTAEYCGVSRSTIYRWIHENELGIYNLPGRGGRAIIRIDSDELEIWLDEHSEVNPADITEPSFTLDSRKFTGKPNISASPRNSLDYSAHPDSRSQGKGFE